MSIIKLPYFGELNVDSLEDYYVAEIEVDGQAVTAELNLDVEDVTLDQFWIDGVRRYVAGLSEHNTNIRDAINIYYLEEGVVKEYIHFHMDELELDTLLEGTDEGLPEEVRMLSVLELKRLAFYPQESSQFAMWDFTFKGEVSDELLVIITNDYGDILGVRWES